MDEHIVPNITAASGITDEAGNPVSAWILSDPSGREYLTAGWLSPQEYLYTSHSDHPAFAGSFIPGKWYPLTVVTAEDAAEALSRLTEWVAATSAVGYWDAVEPVTAEELDLLCESSEVWADLLTSDPELAEEIRSDPHYECPDAVRDAVMSACSCDSPLCFYCHRRSLAGAL